ncbi:hypothetical protein PULV_a2005 [Pseudoalteromonas ulvae UL12]|nr:hypothetical protein [Pseudoalteromonas ulvae UL12]
MAIYTNPQYKEKAFILYLRQPEVVLMKSYPVTGLPAYKGKEFSGLFSGLVFLFMFNQNIHQ